MEYFSYGINETEYLRRQDPLLGEAIDRLGPLSNPVVPDLFAGLVNHIISQQISYKAAETVWRRFRDAFRTIDPVAVAEAEPEELKKIGMSLRKANYIQTIAQHINSGELQIDKLKYLPDEAVRSQLIRLPGIGSWTVDMLMIFSLQRPDVMSWHDLAIRRGLTRLHQLEKIDKKTFTAFQQLYSPHGSVASFYLWEIAHEPV